MKKKLMFILVAILSVFILVSCNANGGDKNSPGSEGGGGTSNSVIGDVSDRKIIYTASISIKSNDLTKTSKEIKELLNPDEWTEREELTEVTNYITIRIKTSRLNEVLSNIKGEYETTNYSLESRDVSLDYFNVTSRKQALEKERARLLELYENASISDMIMINERIGRVDQELISIERQLLEYDSLVDYSTLKIWIYGPKASPTPPDFGNKLSRAFKTGWSSFVILIQAFLQMIFFLVPFLIVIIPVSVVVIYVVYLNKSKKKDKQDKEK